MVGFKFFCFIPDKLAYILIVNGRPGMIALLRKFNVLHSFWTCATVTLRFLADSICSIKVVAFRTLSLRINTVCRTISISIPRKTITVLFHCIFSIKIGNPILSHRSRKACKFLSQSQCNKAINRKSSR